jgi:hypothetical protein
MLTKWTFAVFVAAPFAVTTMDVLTEHSPRQLRNGLLGLLAGGLSAAPWYLVRLAELRSFLAIGRLYAAKEGDPPVCTWQAWSHYAESLVEQQILLPFALLFLLGLGLLLFRRRLDRSVLLLLAWIVVPYLAFSALVNKNDRYLMPCLPAIALVTSLGVAQIRNVRIRRALAAAFALYACVQFAGLSFGLSQRLGALVLPRRVYLRLGDSRPAVYAESAHTASPPRAEAWPIQEILARVLEDRALYGQPDLSSKLVVVPNRAYFEPQGFRYYVEAGQLPLQVVSVTGVLQHDAASVLQTSDYVVTKTGIQGEDWAVQDAPEATRALQDPESELGRRFLQIGEFPLPDGSVALLYRRTS